MRGSPLKRHMYRRNGNVLSSLSTTHCHVQEIFRALIVTVLDLLGPGFANIKS